MCTFFLSKILMTFFFFFFPLFFPLFSPFFLVIALFHDLHSLFFIIIALLNVVVAPLPPPSMHTHMLFYTFLCLALCSRNNKYSVNHLFLLNSSLHKQPFITAHFRSSLHILCITAH